MLARQRQGRILEWVRQAGAVRVAELVRELGVSEMTVRRDLAALAERGFIDKVHGGAAPVRSSALLEPGFAAKSTLQPAEKAAIAAEAATLVAPGMAIGLSAGTTTAVLARRLAEVPGLTVVTNSPRVADAFTEARSQGQTLVLTGGVRTPSDALVGPFALAVLERVHLDLVVLGTHGMEPRAGFTSPNLLEAETNRAMVAAGQRLVIVADHTKWGLVALSSFARLDQADVLISDSGLDAEARAALAAQVRELRCAEVASSASRVA